MSVYSRYEVYPSSFDEHEPVSCYNCNNDCMGILLEIFREGDSS